MFPLRLSSHAERWQATAFLFRLFVVICLGATVCCAKTEYPLKLQADVMDFGPLQRNTAEQRSIKLTNNGMETVSIIGTTADCSCVAAEASPQILEPGKEATILVRFESREYRGLVNKRITVHTTKGSLALPVKATVGLYSNWRLSDIALTILAGQTNTLSIERVAKSPARIMGVKAVPDFLSAEVREEDTSTFLKLQARHDAPVGLHRVTLSIITSDPQEPELKVGVFEEVRGDIAIHPSPLVLPVGMVGATTSAIVNVSGWNNKTKLRAKIDGGRADVVGQNDKGEAQIKIELPLKTSGATSWSLQIFEDDRLAAIFTVMTRASG